MSVVNDGVLAAEAVAIRDETSEGANTATRVGTLFVDFTDSKLNIDQVPKVYSAVLSQTGTSAPTVVIFKNTLGGVPLWTRNNIGDYSITLNGVFTANKTAIPTMNQSLPVADKAAFFSIVDTNEINLFTRLISSGAFADWGLNTSLAVEIIVYP